MMRRPKPQTDLTTFATTSVVTAILLKWHINPAPLILVGGAVGCFALRMA
jgi:hypothetical protein